MPFLHQGLQLRLVGQINFINQEQDRTFRLSYPLQEIVVLICLLDYISHIKQNIRIAQG